MKAFIVLFALVASTYAEADPYLFYGALRTPVVSTYSSGPGPVIPAKVEVKAVDAEAKAVPYGFYGLGGFTGYAGLPLGAYGHFAYPYGLTAAAKTAGVEVKALATPVASTYRSGPGEVVSAPANPLAGSLIATPFAKPRVVAKRDAEAEADPAYFYNGYAGYAGFGYAGYGGYAGFGYYGVPHAYGAYRYGGAYPYAAGLYGGYYGLGLASSDPTNPHLVHTSRLGICTNYLGAQVPC